jgi:hypothetical protein
MKPVKEIFEENFKVALIEMNVKDIDKEQFVITPNTEFEKCTSMDDIYRMWVTPRFAGIRLSFDQVLEKLVKVEKNAIPLWIKMHKSQGKPVILLVSQRYRKIRDVIIRRPDNLIFPFEICEDSFFDFNEEVERLELVRILFLGQKINSELIESIGSEIKYSEVIQNFEVHFENYTFFPPSFNYAPRGEEKYNSLVIKKDISTNQYSIYKDSSLKEEVKTKLNLEEVMTFYISSELNYQIHGIKIQPKK